MEFDKNKEKTIEELLGAELEKAFKDPGADLSFLEEFDPDPERPVPTAAAVAAKADRKRKTRYMKVASWVILLGICGVAVFQGISTENPPIAGDENAYEQMEDKGNGIYMSGDAVDAEDIAVQLKITDESLIPNAAEVLEGLLIPTYIPEGYEFESLEIVQHEDGYEWALYRYVDMGSQYILIFQERNVENKGFDLQVETAGQVMVQGYESCFSTDVVRDMLSLRIFLNEKELLCISGNMNENDILRIAEGLHL